MNNLWPVIIIAAAIVGFVLFWRWRQKQEKIEDAWETPTVSRAFRVVNRVEPERHESGTEMFYEPGVERGLPVAPLLAGRERTLRRIECLGYQVDRARHRTKVVVFPMELSPETRTPCFRVAIWPHNNPLWNSEWDQMRDVEHTPHYVLAAGQTISVGEPYGDIFIIPRSTDESFLETVADHEYEHLGWAHYDANKYYATEYHQEGPHPFIPDTCVGAVAEITGKLPVFPFVIARNPETLAGDELIRKSCLLLTK